MQYFFPHGLDVQPPASDTEYFSFAGDHHASFPIGQDPIVILYAQAFLPPKGYDRDLFHQFRRDGQGLGQTFCYFLHIHHRYHSMHPFGIDSYRVMIC